MKKHNGFFMFDLILTLSSLILISSILMPSVIHYMNETNKEEEKFKATILLFERLHDYLVTGQTIPSEMIQNGMEYKFIFNSQKKEVCILYEDRDYSFQKICEFWE